MGRKQKGIFESQGYKIGTKYLYGIGAGIVIIGALFKILHLPGANIALIVGLGTEALIFFVSALEPLPHEEKHWEWRTVYPELKTEDELTEEEESQIKEFASEERTLQITEKGPAGGKGGIGGIKAPSIGQSPLTNEFFEDLASSVQGLKTNVTKLAEISDASVASNDFARNAKAAAAKMDEINKGLTPTVDAMKSFGNSIQDVKNYQTQVQAVTKNLTDLSGVYQMELQESQKHISSISKFYGGISNVMTNLLETSKDTDSLRQEVTKLTNNMSSLNKIYGGMLTAMTGGGK